MTPPHLERFRQVDELLADHARALGADAIAYGNHCQRVLHFFFELAPRSDEALAKGAIAVAFHDLGIWTAQTFDYLAPSAALAAAHLTSIGRAEWTDEIVAMIDLHHKISRSDVPDAWLVEPFRKADWIDVSLGVVRFGVSRRRVAEVRAAFPNAGFHARLVSLTCARAATHPLDPLPMMKR